MNVRQRLYPAVAVAAVLAGMAAAPAAAQADPGDSADVDVNVDITPIKVPGVLALTVAGNAVSLQENGSDLLVRQFTGTLPTVTVTDTRTADEIPAGSSWAVL